MYSFLLRTFVSRTVTIELLFVVLKTFSFRLAAPIRSNLQQQTKLSTNVRCVREIIGSLKRKTQSRREIKMQYLNFFFRKLLDLIDNQRVGKNIDETFHRELDDRTDKFGVIAKFLGRRLFDKVSW